MQNCEVLVRLRQRIADLKLLSRDPRFDKKALSTLTFQTHEFMVDQERYAYELLEPLLSEQDADSQISELATLVMALRELFYCSDLSVRYLIDLQHALLNDLGETYSPNCNLLRLTRLALRSPDPRKALDRMRKTLKDYGVDLRSTQPQ